MMTPAPMSAFSPLCSARSAWPLAACGGENGDGDDGESGCVDVRTSGRAAVGVLETMAAATAEAAEVAAEVAVEVTAAATAAAAAAGGGGGGKRALLSSLGPNCEKHTMRWRLAIRHREGACMRACVRMQVRACMRACARASFCACMHETRACVRIHSNG
eukprot:2288140-Pleurochrysis_carterae.AAC.1